jgi:uncharacterized membrane protein
MPPFPLIITYTLGIIGTKDIAISKINEAEDTIQELREKDVNVTEAEQLLLFSKQAYFEENYLQAEDYAEKAINKAQNTQKKANDASTKINEAAMSILHAEESGRTSSLEEAKTRLDEARNAFNVGFYEEATSKAVESLELANTSKASSGLTITALILFLIGLSITGLVIFRYRNRGEKEVKKFEEIDLEEIFRQNPQLRQDEQEVIEFISKSSGGVFASDLRDKFDLPRSTAWRMINRLEEAEILKTSLIGRETHVKISEKYRRQGNA